jgi:hypothetical protein
MPMGSLIIVSFFLLLLMAIAATALKIEGMI